eukprot:TRINITY_DN17055_c0_g1_i1.p1 TRINITY_DN17055_c0_g1~~TRINITY_DN17055_c0_g1_i1.p1  ORF type:complete len:360 (-),score=37.34 TRINITY_DN17055_c0_g1_i1:580-1545(-)
MAMATGRAVWIGIVCVVVALYVTRADAVGDNLDQVQEFDSGIRQVVEPEAVASAVVHGDGDRYAPTDYVCKVCMELATEAQAVLTDPEFEHTATEYVEVHACEPLGQAGLRKKCQAMVEEYMPEVFVALKNYAEPESLCVSSGFCPVAREGLLAPHPTDPKFCTVCLDLATDALQFLEANKTTTDIITALHFACSRMQDLQKQCDLLVDVYAVDLIRRLRSTTPEEFCQQTKLCSHYQLSVGKDAKDCQICQFVILELKLKLKDPATQDKIVDLLFRSCSKVPNHVDECRTLVSQYIPFILANLDTILDGNALCSKMGACP